MLDTIIVGAGPAGMTAAIYSTRREMSTMIIGKEIGGQLAWASEIENYPGFRSINNFDLITKMQDQVKGLGVEIKNDDVKSIEKSEAGHFVVFTNKEKFEAKTIILAIGLAPRRLAIPGEIELNGRGVSYCANCDGPLFRNKKVAVVGGGNAALDAAEILSKIASQVYLVHRSEEFKAFETVVDEVKARKNIEILLNTEVKEIIGEGKVQKIKFFNNKSKEASEVEADGIFIEIGRIANTDLVANLVKRDERNQIVVNDRCETSTPGIFAAGDVTQVEFKQITIACGQATVAALAAYQYIQYKQGKDIKMVLDRSVNHSK